MVKLYIFMAKNSLRLNTHVWTRENKSILTYKIIIQLRGRIFGGLGVEPLYMTFVNLLNLRVRIRSIPTHGYPDVWCGYTKQYANL